MKISCISDLHIRKENDKAHNCFKQFVRNSKVQGSNQIFLLGDIFDLMVGNQKQYLNQYKFFFDDLSSLMKSGIKVTYVEGNHDFHLENVFSLFLKKYDLESNLFEYSKDEVCLSFGSKDFIFCHGDIVDDTNESFKKWKSIYRSKPFQILVNILLPYIAVKKIGNKASNDSKKRGSRTFDFENAKKKYIQGATNFLNDKTDTVLVAGHTHIIENIEIGSNHYINNGFPVKDKKFIYLTETLSELVDLS